MHDTGRETARGETPPPVPPRFTLPPETRWDVILRRAGRAAGWIPAVITGFGVLVIQSQLARAVLIFALGGLILINLGAGYLLRNHVVMFDGSPGGIFPGARQAKPVKIGLPCICGRIPSRWHHRFTGEHYHADGTEVRPA
jgi:hypothetical protein